MAATGAPDAEDALVEVIVEHDAWTAALPDLEAVADAAAALALEAAGIDPAGRAIALLACDDARIAGLNAAHRGRAAPTNVLSWPHWPLAPATPGDRPPAPPGPGPLGDLAIALETCAAEAKAAGIALKDHVTHLILHGCLHLLGYDHATAADADLMEGIETRALARLGIADPYDRGDAGPPRRT